MKSVNRIGMLLSLALVAFVGCSRNDRTASDKVQAHEEVGEMPYEYKNELSSRLRALSDLIRTQPRESKARCSELLEWVCSREMPNEREYGVEQLEHSILATETRSLPNADRERAINAMFDLMMTDVLNGLSSVGASQSRKWKSRFRFLRRVRNEIDHAREDAARIGISEIDKRRLLHLTEFVRSNYNMWLKWMERDFVTYWIDEIESDEYDYIRKEFEELLGRPLKTGADYK